MGSRKPPQSPSVRKKTRNHVSVAGLLLAISVGLLTLAFPVAAPYLPWLSHLYGTGVVFVARNNNVDDLSLIVSTTYREYMYYSAAFFQRLHNVEAPPLSIIIIVSAVPRNSIIQLPSHAVNTNVEILPLFAPHSAATCNNIGASMATTAFVTFFDMSSIPHPARFKFIRHALKKYPSLEGIVFSSIVGNCSAPDNIVQLQNESSMLTEPRSASTNTNACGWGSYGRESFMKYLYNGQLDKGQGVDLNARLILDGHDVKFWDVVMECKVSPDPFWQIEVGAAWDHYRMFGKLTSLLDTLKQLRERGGHIERIAFDYLQSLHRLKDGWIIPRRRPAAAVPIHNKALLYCLSHSIPNRTDGYATRSHGVAVGLQNSGWKVWATTRPGFPEDLASSYRELVIENVTYSAATGWPIGTIAIPLDSQLAAIADHFFREAQGKRVEVIVAASNHLTALPALAAARRLGLPFVYEVRGLWEVTHASLHPDWADSEHFHIMRTLEAQAAKNADLVVTLTSELADELVSRGVHRKRIVFVPNAADADRFKPQSCDRDVVQELQLNLEVPVIGFAGSAIAYEGLELLVSALAGLTRNGVAYTFLLVGDGAVFETVKSQASQLGIESNCRFTGRIPFDRVSRYIACMDIMPVPRLSSTVTEMVSALKPLEAMAMGKSVVLSDVSPHKTIAGNNERALLFRKDNVSSLGETLSFLLASSEERQRLGRAARQWVVEQRNWNEVTKTYAQALLTLNNTATAGG